MSIIAVKNVPPKMSLKDISKELKRPIRGYFEALNFGKQGKRTQTKTCYIRLSEKVDPVHAVQNINNSHYKARGKYYAYIPDEVPDLPLGGKKTNKKVKRKQMPIEDFNAEGRAIKVTAVEILAEIQAKYPGIYALSKKHDHKLLKELYKILYDRAKTLIEGNTELESSTFQSTRAFRKAYPHAGDFELVLTTLHAIEEQAGLPKTELHETEINSPTQPTLVFDLPVDKVKGLCDKYTNKIVTQMTEYLDKTPCDVTQLDTAEEVARKQVRQELKKLQPFLPIIVSGVMCKHFIPPEGKTYRMKMYGEPNLPKKEVLIPFLTRHRCRGAVIHSKRVFNMLMFSIAPEAYHKLIAQSGTVLNGSKLIIAASDVLTFKSTTSHSESGAGNEEDADEGDADERDADEEGEDEPMEQDDNDNDDDDEV